MFPCLHFLFSWRKNFSAHLNGNLRYIAWLHICVLYVFEHHVILSIIPICFSNTQLCSTWILVSYYESTTCTGMQYCHHANTILQTSLGEVHNLFLKQIIDIIRTKVTKCEAIKCLCNGIMCEVISKTLNGSTQWHFTICVVLIYLYQFQGQMVHCSCDNFKKIFTQWWYDVPKHIVLLMHYMVLFDWDICIH